MRTKTEWVKEFGIFIAALTLPVVALAQDVPVREATVKVPEKHYSPYVGRNIPDRVLWGDTHLHTALSPDAGLPARRWGRTRPSALHGARS